MRLRLILKRKKLLNSFCNQLQLSWDIFNPYLDMPCHIANESLMALTSNEALAHTIVQTWVLCVKLLDRTRVNLVGHVWILTKIWSLSQVRSSLTAMLAPIEFQDELMKLFNLVNWCVNLLSLMHVSRSNVMVTRGMNLDSDTCIFAWSSLRDRKVYGWILVENVMAYIQINIFCQVTDHGDELYWSPVLVSGFKHNFISANVITRIKINVET